jgi:hypothetical protein
VERSLRKTLGENGDGEEAFGSSAPAKQLKEIQKKDVWLKYHLKTIQNSQLGSIELVKTHTVEKVC